MSGKSATATYERAKDIRNTNLDTLITPGVYAFSENDKAPDMGEFLLVVFRNNSNKSNFWIIQTLTRISDGETFSRSRRGSDPWGEWTSATSRIDPTNLTAVALAAVVDIHSSTGSGATIESVTAEHAGVMLPADKDKLDNIAVGAQVNPTPEEIVESINIVLGGDAWQSVNLGADRTTTQVTVTNSAGLDSEIPSANSTFAGVMSAADKIKLDGIEEGAEVNPTDAELVEGINAELGNTAWQGDKSGNEVTNATVRVVSDSHVTLSNITAGTVIDGITLENDNLVLLIDQNSPAENGLYVVGSPSVRPPAYDSFSEIAGLIITVQAGTVYNGSVWLCTSEDGGTIDVDPLAFSRTSIAPTNLSVTRDANQALINSSTGSSAVLGAATTTQSGVLTASDKAKLDSIESGAQRTDITVEHAPDGVSILSSDGDGGTLNPVTVVNAGAMTPTMLSKLNSIEFGATTDMLPAEVVAAVNAALGNTDWQSGGGGGSGSGGSSFAARGSGWFTSSGGIFPLGVEIYDPDNKYNTSSWYWQPNITEPSIVVLSVQSYFYAPATSGGSGVSSRNNKAELYFYKNGTIIENSRVVNASTNNTAAARYGYIESIIVDYAAPGDYYRVAGIVAARLNGVIQYYGQFYGDMTLFAGGVLGGGGSSAPPIGTNLTISRDATQAIVNSSTGTGGAIPAATTSLAGVLSAADKVRVDSSISADEENQELSGGFSAIPKDLGVVTSGSVVVDPSDRTFQQLVCDGSFSLEPSEVTGQCSLYITMGDTADIIDVSEWSVVVGDPLTFSAGEVFRLGVEIAGEHSILFILKVS